MTLNWATQVSFEPKLVGISVEKDAFTHELIAAGKVFSLNLLPQEERAAVRKFVKPVEVDADGKTLNGFAFHDGRTGAPILDQSLPPGSTARCASRSTAAATPSSSARSSTPGSRPTRRRPSSAWRTPA